MNQSMSLRPRVGISADFWTFPSGHVSDCGPAFDRVKQAYSLHVAQRGALPLVLPNLHDEGMVNDYLVLLDGLLLHGGADVHPTHYRQELRYSDCHIQPLRDAFELPLVRRAVEIGLPIFGICRGLQGNQHRIGRHLVPRPQPLSRCRWSTAPISPSTTRRHEVVARSRYVFGSSDWSCLVVGRFQPPSNDRTGGTVLGRFGPCTRRCRGGGRRAGRVPASCWACSGIRRTTAAQPARRCSTPSLRRSWTFTISE